jgi:hypothetical protein
MSLKKVRMEGPWGEGLLFDFPSAPQRQDDQMPNPSVEALGFSA